jgi:ABC-2 type transport system ATP-binding protein
MILALSCNVPFVLLDEPVLGLDANHRDMFYKELLKNYSEKPKTIVISTH